MSTPTSLVKQFLREQPAANDATSTDTASDGPSLSEVKAAAKEGTAEALAEYRPPADDADVTTAEHENTDNGSQDESSLKRGVVLVLVAVYLLRRRRRSRQSTDAQ